MRMLSRSAAWAHRIPYSFYVARKLRTAGLTDLENQVKSTALELQRLGRAWEDAELSVQEMLADRDSADDGLDETAREARRQLAARSGDATKKPPYSAIFPDRIAFYTMSPVAEEQGRYQLLIDRITTHLADDDGIRTGCVPKLQEGIQRWDRASEAVTTVRNGRQQARDAVEAATDGWHEQIERLFGKLQDMFGKEKAEKFFPAVRSEEDEQAASGGSSG